MNVPVPRQADGTVTIQPRTVCRDAARVRENSPPGCAGAERREKSRLSWSRKGRVGAMTACRTLAARGSR